VYVIAFVVSKTTAELHVDQLNGDGPGNVMVMGLVITNDE